MQLLDRLENRPTAMMGSQQGFAEVSGGKVNREAGYGLEVPCTYRLYGPNLRSTLMYDSLRSAGHL